MFKCGFYNYSGSGFSKVELRDKFIENEVVANASDFAQLLRVARVRTGCGEHKSVQFYEGGPWLTSYPDIRAEWNARRPGAPAPPTSPTGVKKRSGAPRDAALRVTPLPTFKSLEDMCTLYHTCRVGSTAEPTRRAKAYEKQGYYGVFFYVYTQNRMVAEDKILRHNTVRNKHKLSNSPTKPGYVYAILEVR